MSTSKISNQQIEVLIQSGNRDQIYVGNRSNLQIDLQSLIRAISSRFYLLTNDLIGIINKLQLNINIFCIQKNKITFIQKNRYHCYVKDQTSYIQKIKISRIFLHIDFLNIYKSKPQIHLQYLSLFFLFTIQQNSTTSLYYKCLSYQSCSLFIDQPLADLSFQLLILFLSLAQTSFDYNKLYIGQIPLSITEPFIRDVLSKFTEVKDVRIIKGDARGTFDRFCYAFAMVRGNQDICNQVIKKVNQQHPDWKINIKVDNDRFKYMQQHQNPPRQNMPMNPYHQQQRGGFQQKQLQPPYYQQQSYPPGQPQTQHQQFQPPGQQFVPPPQQYYNPPHQHQYQPPTNEPEKIVGEKHHKILVRQVWLGGIPQLCDKHYMHQLMSEFGIIQNLEVFPKFAFIKFRMVEQASLAFQRAQRIYMMFGNPPGFRILFSDPSRRANIVGNHYQYDRQSPFLPILFLGFPPITSATIDLQIMKSICEKYGTIVNSYMRKNSNNQTRSYFLFTFDNLKSALRAKTQLNRRKDLLGDKRVQVTLLLDQEIILKNRDFSYTERMFQGDGNTGDRKRVSNQPVSSDKPFVREQRSYQNYPPKQVPPITNPPNIPPYPGMYHQQPPTMHYPGYMIPQSNQPPQTYPPSSDLYYMPPNMYYPNNGKQQRPSSDVHQLLQSVFERTSAERQQENPHLQKKPVKTSTNNDENTSDLVSKMLGHDKETDQHQKQKERQVTWSGFLTWKGLHRVQVDGYAESKELEDYVISINHVIDLKDIVRKEKTTMILACGSPIHEALFKQYLRALRGKAGVSSTPHSLMYILSKSKESDQIQEIRDNELLVVMERPSLFSLIKDKLQKCQELK